MKGAQTAQVAALMVQGDVISDFISGTWSSPNMTVTNNYRLMKVKLLKI